MRGDLKFDRAGATERLLIERILATWLRVQFCEAVASVAEGRGEQERWRKGLASSSQQHVAALVALHSVRGVVADAPPSPLRPFRPDEPNADSTRERVP
jgi:hypothetical protein